MPASFARVLGHRADRHRVEVAPDDNNGRIAPDTGFRLSDANFWLTRTNVRSSISIMAIKSSLLFPDSGSRRSVALRSALRLFTQKGFFNTSLQNIVSESGTSVGFIYHHFRDKEGIAWALYNHLLDRMNALIDDIEATHGTAQARCHAVIKMLFELTEAEPDIMGFIIHARHREFLPDAKAICSASAFIRMRGFVFEGIERGEIRRMDPMMAAVITYGGAIRMICLRLDGVIEQALDGYLEELWANTWQALRP